MKSHDFRIILDQNYYFEREQVTAIYDVMKDCILLKLSGRPGLDFTRQAKDPKTAVNSAIKQLTDLGFKVLYFEYENTDDETVRMQRINGTWTTVHDEPKRDHVVVPEEPEDLNVEIVEETDEED
jgi:hypothetical protein